MEKEERKRLLAMTLFERKAWGLRFKNVVGVDEAGRGPLAGPVVAAACSIQKGVYFKGINDSKQLSPLFRKSLFQQLTTHPKVSFGLGQASVETIDQVNIYQATILAMKQAVDNLGFIPDYLLIDGLNISYKDIPSEKIIRGDEKSQMIAAASIIAKETRDKMMCDYHEKFPQYGFDQHKGYGTEKHLKALNIYGPSPIHRLSFEPCKSKDSAALTFSKN